MAIKNKVFLFVLVPLCVSFFWIAAEEQNKKDTKAAEPEVKKDKPLDSRITAGNRFQVEFDEFPKTLVDTKSDIWIYIPTDYDPAKKHPLFLWLGEAKGHHQDRRNLVDGKNFICVSFPLYRKTGPVAEGVSAETVKRIHLSEDDAELIWPIYKKMIAKVEELVPNIDPNIRLVGGFSNGAHCMTILLNGSNGEFHNYFNAYFFVEGGFPYKLKENKKYSNKNCMLAMYGEKSAKNNMMIMAKQAAKFGVDVEEVEMKEIGHAFPKDYMPKVTDWINRKVIFGYLTEKLEGVKKLIKQSKNAEALNQLDLLKTEVQGHEVQTKQVEEVSLPLEEKAGKEVKGVLKEAASKGTTKKYKIDLLEKFIKKWPKTKAAAEAQKALEELE
jgi:predicted esterase